MKTTDRELLELAANAAGLRVIDRSYPVTLYIETDGCKCGVAWNPLTDDGDALRLVVKLNDFEPYKSSGGFRLSPSLSIDDTRRAIVRAAAEIGKNMK